MEAKNVFCMFHDPENSDAGMWKTLGGPVAVVIGGDNLPSPIRIGLTDLPNIGGASDPPAPSPRFRHHCSVNCQ